MAHRRSYLHYAHRIELKKLVFIEISIKFIRLGKIVKLYQIADKEES